MGQVVRDAIKAGAISGADSIDLAFPHALYETEEQARLFEVATQQNPAYRQALDAPLQQLIAENADKLIPIESSTINFIDLGPGYPAKSLVIVDHLLSLNSRVTYTAVDISKFFLDRAASAALSRGISVTKVRRKFQDLPSILDGDTSGASPRLIFFGLTFNNFPLTESIKILQPIVRTQDRAIICAQCLTSTDLKRMVQPFDNKPSADFAVCGLVNIGLPADSLDYAPRFEDSAINIDFILNRDVPYEDVILKVGTRITVSRSLRYERQALVQTLLDSFHTAHIAEDNQRGLVVMSLGGKE